MKKTFPKRALSLFLLLAMLSTLLVCVPTAAAADVDDYDGSQLWLNYTLVEDAELLGQYKAAATSIVVENYDQTHTYRHQRDGETWEPVQPEDAQEALPASTLEAARLELHRAFSSLLGVEVPYADAVTADGAVVVGTPESSPIIAALNLGDALESVGDEGYLIRSVTIDGHAATVIAGNTDIGALYGTYAFLRLMQTQKSVTDLDVADQPKVEHRRLNNWDTERLYAGTGLTGEGGDGSNGEDGSIFNFKDSTGDLQLPLILDRYIVFARMCASVGINEIIINNVNADYKYLSEAYIQNEAALADVLRPYGIRIGLSVRYVSPTDAACNTAEDVAAGGPERVDPSNEDAANPYADVFQNWWTQKTEQIRSRIPDFLGYTVKANSEGQPGPQDYGYDHGDGAHGMGLALEHVDDGQPNDMTLFWRTFVYNASVDVDRLKRAYLEFKPINDDEDRGFGDNVFIQTKNGPLDFQGREPFNPLFGAMDVTNQAIELQITQEYTGHHVSLCYLAPMWEEVFKTNTRVDGQDVLVGEIVDGTAQGQKDTAIVGVDNIGNAPNMTGHHFSQANFFAFGRLAWDWTLSSEDIADDWVRMTWGNDQQVVDTIKAMMMGSWEALVSYQTPLGVAHQMTGTGTHYFPNPAQIIYNGGQIRDDWSPAYYSRVDGVGIGYNRSTQAEQTSFGALTGSGFTQQYSTELAALYDDMDTTPENLLLWFHHVPWDYEMDSGRTLWEELVYRTQMGVQYVTWMRDAWASLEGKIDQRRFDEVTEKLWRQEIDASEWRDMYAGYWQKANGLETPVDDGPLSIAVTLGTGSDTKTYQGFNLAVDSFNKTAPGNLPKDDPRYDRYIAAGGQIADYSTAPFSNMFTPVDTYYTLAVPAGVERTITDVTFLSDEGTNCTYEIVSQDEQQAVVKVSCEGFFGPLVKYYNFHFVTDTQLSDLSVDGKTLAAFDPEQTSYTVQLDDAITTVPLVKATADDASATVEIAQAESIPGDTVVTVKNGQESETYTVHFLRSAAVTDTFDGDTLDEAWSWVREDNAQWSLSDGALTIQTQAGDLKGQDNSAKNLLVRDIGSDGDWTAQVKLTFPTVPTQANQQGGLVIYQDDDNYIKVNLEYITTGSFWSAQRYLRVSMGVESQGNYSDCFYDALEIEEHLADSDGALWLRIVKEGDTYRGYWATDPDAAYKNLGECTLSMSDSKVGLLAANGSNSPSIPVVYDDFSLTDSNQSVVVPTPVTGVKLNEQNVYLYTNYGPSTVQLTASVEPADANNQLVSWSSSDENVATVDDNGLVRIVGEGMTTITVTTADGNFTADCLVQVGTYNDGGDDGQSGSTGGSTTQPGETTDPGETTEPEAPAFSDVPATHWAYSAVEYVVDKGLFNGTSATTFSPETPMTRAMFFTVLARMDGVDTTGGTTWYDKALAWAVSEGISDGTNPEATITREQLAVMLYRYSGSPEAQASLSTFSDAASVSDWAQDGMNWAVAQGILTGKTGGLLDPQGTASRAEVATMLMRMDQLN